MKNIVVMGGGTGTFTVLTGLKKYPVDLTAIVSMADDGGSTGRLRDEYGVLPPGDIRQCLVALSDASTTMRDLFNYRFSAPNGGAGLSGHSFGNIFITALEKMTGDFNSAMEIASEVLKVRGMVLPVTLDSVHLRVELKNGKVIHGEHSIDAYQMISRFGVKNIRLDKKAAPNPRALRAIKYADMVVVGPGSFYTSLVPNFLVSGVANAFKRSKATKVLVVNLMNRYGQTDNFSVMDYVNGIEKIIGAGQIFDYVLYNKTHPSRAMLKRYLDEGDPVQRGGTMKGQHCVIVEADLLKNVGLKKKAGDVIERSLIRHDPDKLAAVLVSLLRRR